MPQSTTEAQLCVPRAPKHLENLENEDKTRERANWEDSEHPGTRQVTTECGGQAPTWCTLFLKLGACLRRSLAQTRTVVNTTMKKLMVGDIVGLLCSIHSCSYLLNAFENQTQWRRNRRNKADTSQPKFQNRCDGTELQQRHFHPPCLAPATLANPWTKSSRCSSSTRSCASNRNKSSTRFHGGLHPASFQPVELGKVLHLCLLPPWFPTVMVYGGFWGLLMSMSCISWLSTIVFP